MLRVEPRKERTLWKTKDGRFFFRRDKGQWTIKAYNTPILDLLVQAGLVHHDSTCLIAFPSLKEAKTALEGIVASLDISMDPPFDLHLCQANTAYEVEGGIAYIAHEYSGWTVNRKTEKLTSQQQQWMQSETYYWRRWYHFPTRKAALKALERWLETGELPEFS